MKYKYDAFISYRHTELDRFAAENLHRQMEAFRLPGKISGRTAERTRIERVFRDKDELPLTNNLEDPIMKALAESEYLIVICSPRLRESLWCRKEIETFIRLHGREKVLAVLIEGEPAESFPEELLYVEETVAGADGSVSTVRRAVEPLAADIRGRNRHEMLKALKTEKLRLLAPMFSLNYDDLRQRHRERKMRRILGASLAAASFFLCFGAFSTAMALRIRDQNVQLEAQAEEIQRQNESLMLEQALNLAEDSRRLLAEGDRVGAVRTAIRSLTEYEGIPMPYTAQGEYALTESLHIYDHGTNIKPRHQMEAEGIIRSMRVSPDGKRLLTRDDSGALTLWDIAAGSRIAVMEDSDIFLSESGGYVFLDDARFAYRNGSGGITIYDWQEKRREDFLEETFPGGLETAGKLLAVEYDRELQIYRTDTLEYLGSYTTEQFGGLPGDIFLDGESMVAVFQELTTEEGVIDAPRRLVFWNIETGNTGATELGKGRLQAVCCVGGTAYALCDYADDTYTNIDTRLLACSVDTGEILWEKIFEGTSGDMLFRPYAEGADKLLVATTHDAWLVGMEDGEEYVRFSLGSSIVGGEALPESDIYVIYTRNGEFYSILPESLTAYTREGRFQSHSQNVRELAMCAGGFLVAPYQDNRVTLYTYSGNPAYEALTDPVEPEEGEYLDSLEAVEFAGEKGLASPALAQYVFYSGDGTLVYVCYSNGKLRVYDAATYELKAELTVDSAYIRREIGVDDRGNRYVGGPGQGYMLNRDLEILAAVENLIALDNERNRLIVGTDGGDQAAIPVYTVEELLDNAREYVLSCNYSEPAGDVSK